MAQVSLKLFGGFLTALVLVLIVLNAAVSLEIFNPYPAVPREYADKPRFGRATDEIMFNDLWRHPEEQLAQYQGRLTMAVNAHMIHFWPSGERQWTGINPMSNWLLWAKGFVPGYEHFANKELLDPRLAWVRGYGFCSQVSRLIYSILLDQGLPSRIMQHPNHVVVEASGMVLDADYGVVIPHTLIELQSRPDLVAKYYVDFPSAVENLQRIYADGWTETATPLVFANGRAVEKEAELLKWLSLAMCLWMSIAVFDAGFCLARTRKQTKRHPFAFRLSSFGPLLSSRVIAE